MKIILAGDMGPRERELRIGRFTKYRLLSYFFFRDERRFMQFIAIRREVENGGKKK